MDQRHTIPTVGLTVPEGAQALRIINVREHLHAPLDVAVPDSPATGRAFFCSPAFPVPLPENAHLGVDMLYLPPEGSFPLHTHPGHHLLFIVHGRGTVTFGDAVYETVPGDLYLIDASVPHAVGAGPDGHWLMAFGAPHKHLDAPDRMTVLVDRREHDRGFVSAEERPPDRPGSP